MNVKNVFNVFLILVLVSVGVYFVSGGDYSGSFVTPSNNGFVDGNYTFNVSFDGTLSNVTNITFFNMTGSDNALGDGNSILDIDLNAGLDVSLVNITINTHNFTEGNYTFMAMFANDSAVTNFTNITFLIDHTSPSTIDLLYPINSTEIIDNTSINFNFTVIDSFDVNLNCNLTVDGTVINSTITGADINNSRVPIVVSATDIDQGLHYWNITCWDNSIDLNGISWNMNDTSRPNRTAGVPESLNIGANFTLTDNTPPTTATPTLSASSVVTGNSVTITCVGTDLITSNPTELVSIQNPDSDWQGDVGSSPYTYTGTSDIGTYTARCRSRDTAGNTGGYGTSATFAVTRAVSGTGTTSTGGSSGTGTKTVNVLSGQTRDLGSISGGEGVINAYRASTVSFGVMTSSGNALSTHSIFFDNVDFVGGEATITISSDPVTLTMNVGDVETVDVDGDGVDDIEVTLNNIDSNGKVNMNIKDLGETAPADEGEGVTGEGGEGVTGGDESTGGMAWYWWLIILIVIVVIVALILPKKR